MQEQAARFGIYGNEGLAGHGDAVARSTLRRVVSKRSQLEQLQPLRESSSFAISRKIRYPYGQVRLREVEL